MTLDHPPIAPSTTGRTLATSRWDADDAVDLAEATIADLVRDRAREHPDVLALVGVRHDGSALRASYTELLTAAREVAAGLRRVAAPGDHVALWAPNVAEWPVIEYGAALAGVVLVALNPVLRGPELDYALRLSRASVLIHADVSRDYDMAAVARSVVDDLPALRHRISLGDPDRLRATPGDDATVDPASPAMIQFTSGTTGHPKAVLLAHRSLVNNARLTMITGEVPARSVGIAPLPMFHTAACVISTLGPAWLGGTQVLIEKFAPGEVLAAMAAEDADVLFSVATVLGAVLEAARGADGPAPQLSTVLVGASTVPGSMIEAVERTFGASVHNLFGQTELSPVLSLTRRTDTREDLTTKVGRPLPHTAAQIVDPVGGEVVPIGQQGEICARGYSQMIEYFDDADATASTVDAEGWLHTGDLGTMDDRGLITVTGRLKEIIIRGGENIAPAEIEIALAAHPQVLRVAVLGLPDEHWGEIVAAAVVVRDPAAEGVRDDLEAFARERLATYKVPARWFLVDDLPTTPSGKVQKFALRDELVGSVL
ncbi:putative fatty-acid-CoA ligase [Actinomycetospora sp. NBRC 106375]|uniref:class I adenylate-forming enzyme family protein n=1 Tax=Actinomycetospora sp. NBRC 106375 TaxID=3032207 RepID=UPI0024A06D14|nr:AMP-binding protein [Actinomycetospora sp. NBRC 106375]GLZ49090.1 putative fatty-acid-CoA ligase [Actinomycetospora sp. NBRC 106375]